MKMKKKNYFEECVKILSILKDNYGKSISWHINEATKNSDKVKTEISDEDLYISLLEHKENQTIYHNIQENDLSIQRIYQEGVNLGEVFFDEEDDDNEDKF